VGPGLLARRPRLPRPVPLHRPLDRVEIDVDGDPFLDPVAEVADLLASQ
jgi:hypothetical protein